jgi:hypothetical protein
LCGYAREIEKLEEQISDIKQEIEKYKGQGVNTAGGPVRVDSP